MSDFERYGDYNEISESPTGNKGLKIIKAVAVTLCFAVVGLLLFRLFSFTYYPKKMKRLYFNDVLTAYYNENSGDIEPLTQTWRNYGYDDPDEGNFFCDNLIIIPEIGQLQISVRYNTSLMEKLTERHGIGTPSPDDFSIYTFRLVGVRANDEIPEGTTDAGRPISATVEVPLTDTFLMYRYQKLVIDGIDFGTEEAGDAIRWLRLEIDIKGAKEGSEPYKILIYQNTGENSGLKTYELKKGERP